MKRRPKSKRISRAGGSGSSTLLKAAIPLFLAAIVVLAGPEGRLLLRLGRLVVRVRPAADVDLVVLEISRSKSVG